MQEFVKILSIDPGVSNLGWACSIYTPALDILEVQKFGALKASKIANKQKELANVYGTRILALKEIEQHMSKLLRSFNPDFVCSEDAFFYIKSPTAYGALSMVIHTIERVMFLEYEQFHKTKETARTLYKFSPRNIKSIATGNSLSLKENMLESLLDNENIKFKLKENEKVEDVVNTLNQHAVDAISCGFTFCHTALPGILLG